MNLPVPEVGISPGPDYATSVDNCLTIIDSHTHAPGSGVQVTPEGLNINADLSVNVNNLTLVRTVRFQSQPALLSAAADIGCLYESGVDLYFNDGSGNQVRITQSGGVAGTPGSISNLTSPASASYVSASQTFVFQSDANTAANIDGGSFILRNIVANSNGLTLSPPNALASSYTITLPTLPVSSKILTIGSTGTIAAALDVDNTTIQISSNALQVAAAGITQTQLYTRTTGTTVSAGNVVITAPDTNSTSSTTTIGAAGGLTTTGRPVIIMLVCNGSNGDIQLSGGATLTLFRDSTIISTSTFTGTSPNHFIMPNFIDVPSAGVHTYVFQINVSSGSVGWTNLSLVAYEIN